MSEVNKKKKRKFVILLIFFWWRKISKIENFKNVQTKNLRACVRPNLYIYSICFSYYFFHSKVVYQIVNRTIFIQQRQQSK